MNEPFDRAADVAEAEAVALDKVFGLGLSPGIMAETIWNERKTQSLLRHQTRGIESLNRARDLLISWHSAGVSPMLSALRETRDGLRVEVAKAREKAVESKRIREKEEEMIARARQV